MRVRPLEGLQEASSREGEAMMARLICVPRLLLVLVPTLGLVACGQGGGQSASSRWSDSSRHLHGYWKTDLRTTQLGRGFDALCLAPDGTYVSVFHSEGADLIDRGTYSITDDVVRFDGIDGSYDERFAWHRDRLEIGSADGEPLRYRRLSEECPELKKQEPPLAAPGSGGSMPTTASPTAQQEQQSAQ